MDIKDFPTLTLEGDMNSIVLLGPPEESTLKDADPALKREIANAFYKMWLKLLSNNPDLPDEIHAKCPGCDYVLDLSGNEVWDRLLLCIGAYYDYCVQSLILHEGISQEPIAGLEDTDIRELLSLREAIEDFSDHDREWGWKLSFNYLIGLFAYNTLLFILRAGIFPYNRSSNFEDFFHNILAKIHFSEISARTDNQKMISTRFLHNLLHNVHEYYEMKAEASPQMDFGPFSSIQHSEIPLLAKRDKSLIKKYGSKAIETVFEYQLALIVQSLGFYVVNARRGERTVDLVCVSGDPRESITIMIEAKTSSKAYSLPTKDERALSEYIRTVTQNIAPLPALKYVLIIGYKASKTLGNKLRRLETDTQTPIRFCAAKDLASLREHLPGPVPIGVLTEIILSGSHILPEGWTSEVTGQYEIIHHNLVNLVRSMLPDHDLSHRDIDTWVSH